LKIFRTIEDSMSAMGVDGRACLLRLICEMQNNPIGRFTVIGELLSILFTPKRGLNDFLHYYIEAEVKGSEGADCRDEYPTCPFSLINSIKQWDLYQQSQSKEDPNPEASYASSFLTNNINQMSPLEFL
ncbi:unnamed protein product, partial [Meganyctiphanes norvegica]